MTAKIKTLDWTVEYSKDRRHQKTQTILQKTNDKFNELLLLLMIPVLTTLVTFLMNMFEFMMSRISEGCLYSKCFSLGYGTFLWVIVTRSFYAFLAAFLCSLQPHTAGSGITQVKSILGGFVIKDVLVAKTLFIKIVALALSVASGLVLGKEGPMIHLASCVGNLCSNLFGKYKRNEANKREILSACTAVGVACAFGTPIGGVLFAIEELAYFYSMTTVYNAYIMSTIASLCVLVAKTAITDITKLIGEENDEYLFLDIKTKWKIFELPLFALLGIFGGLYGAMFIKMNIKMYKFRKSSFLSKKPMLEATAIAFATCLIGYNFAFLKLHNMRLLNMLFRECQGDDSSYICATGVGGEIYLFLMLLFAAVVKCGFAVITFGMAVPAGIFIPSLVVGACVGRAFGILVSIIYDALPDLFASCPKGDVCINPNIYAVIGAISSLCGVTRVTVSLVVIIFELTGAGTYILPIMVAVLMAKLVGDHYHPKSIYNELILLAGYPYITKEQTVTPEIISNIMTPITPQSCINISEDRFTLNPYDYKNGHLYQVDFQVIETLLDEYPYDGFPVIQDTLFCGYVSRKSLASALRNQRDFRNPLTFSRSPNNINDGIIFINNDYLRVGSEKEVAVCLEFFKKLGIKYVFVVKEGRLLGMVSKQDIFSRAF